MANQKKVVERKLSPLELGECLQNVSGACRIHRQLEAHDSANVNCYEMGSAIIQLANEGYDLYSRQNRLELIFGVFWEQLGARRYCVYAIFDNLWVDR